MPQTSWGTRQGRADGIERDLVHRAQLGDVDAFSALTAGRTNRLYAAARLILRDGTLAEDVVQEVLLRAWQDLRGLREPDRFDAWLHRILVRTCYRSAARARRRATFEAVATDETQPDVADPPSSVETRDLLERGFERLSPDQRAVIVLHHYLGYSLAEAAEVLGVPLGTVQSRLHRALKAMRAGLDADDRPQVLPRWTG